MSEVVWWTGVVAWTGIASFVLWCGLHMAAFAFDATWFTARCLLEGGTKNTSVLNTWRIWKAGFLGHIHSVRAGAGYYIVYPGYGRDVPEDEAERD